MNKPNKFRGDAWSASGGTIVNAAMRHGTAWDTRFLVFWVDGARGRRSGFDSLAAAREYLAGFPGESTGVWDKGSQTWSNA